jgi:hypothetical protein
MHAHSLPTERVGPTDSLCDGRTDAPVRRLIPQPRGPAAAATSPSALAMAAGLDEVETEAIDDGSSAEFRDQRHVRMLLKALSCENHEVVGDIMGLSWPGGWLSRS